MDLQPLLPKEDKFPAKYFGAKGDLELINAWAFNDWANGYSLVIATAVFYLL
jgi:hypothetical protein